MNLLNTLYYDAKTGFQSQNKLYKKAKEIEGVTLFKEITSVIFKYMSLGTITSIITAVTLRANLRG